MTLEELERDKADRQEVNEQFHYLLTETAKFWNATQEDLKGLRKQVERVEGKVDSLEGKVDKILSYLEDDTGVDMDNLPEIPGLSDKP